MRAFGPGVRKTRINKNQSESVLYEEFENVYYYTLFLFWGEEVNFVFWAHAGNNL